MSFLLEKSAPPLRLSPQLVAFVKRQIRNAALLAGPERRDECRQAIIVPAIVQPIDRQFRAIDAPIAMVTRDVTARGIALVHEDRILFDLLAMQLGLPDEETILVGEVRWKKPVGPYYSCGCEVIAKLDELPEYW